MDAVAVARDAVNRRFANQDPVEAAAFLDLVSERATVVEIGCLFGGMLWAYREMGAGLVIGVDKDAASSGLSAADHGATVIDGDSHHADTLLRLRGALGRRPIDVLFIDGDHTYDGVSKDFEWYAPLVGPNGIVAFHDICGHFLFPDTRVDKFWWEVCRDHPKDTSEIINRHRPWGHGMGIGVLRCN